MHSYYIRFPINLKPRNISQENLAVVVVYNLNAADWRRDDRTYTSIRKREKKHPDRDRHARHYRVRPNRDD